MRSSLWVSLLAVGAAACASSPSSSSSGGGAAATPAPAARPAAATTTTTTTTTTSASGANPCAAGGCKLTVQVDPGITDIMSQKRLGYRVIKGCPRENGGTTGDALKTVPPLLVFQSATGNLPAFEGKMVTVIYVMGSQPEGGIAVVDFSTGTSQSIKAPFQQGGANGYQSDDVVRNKNTTAVNRCSNK